MNNKDDYNKRIIIATILSTILMVLWIRYYGKKTIPAEVLQAQKEIKQEQIIEIKEEEKIDTEIQQEEISFNENEILEERLLNIDTEKLKGSINLRGLVFDNLILENYKQDIGSNEKVKLLSEQNSNDTYFVKFNWESEDKNLDLPNINTLWSSNSATLTINKPVILSYKNKQGLTFQLIITLDSNYMFEFRQVVINPTENTYIIKTNNQISRKNAILDRSVSVHEGFIGSFNKELEEIKYKKIEKRDYDFKKGFSWAGWSDKYWLVAFAQQAKHENIADVDINYSNNLYNIDFESENMVVGPKQKIEFNTLLFAGPKILNLLDTYSFQYNLPLFDRAVDFGWFYFLTKPIYMVLKFFYGILGNFGVAILLLTLLVKTIMYPFTKKSFISMAKIKKIQPKIDNLKNVYGNDKLGLNKAMMDLYKKENVSPLSGCLPMLVQIPVFFSLYKVLAISIDMRQAPFFGYIKNLAEKDPTTIWNLFGLLPYHVNFLHIGLLPCLMSLTMWIQQKMTSASGGSSSNQDMQTATKMMPLIFLFLFSGMPAGLLIYWTFSNIISIGQQYYVEKKVIKTK